jgi:UDP-glucuronate 4-epimerase
MHVLVTGAAGFIGSRLSAALLARGDEVVGLDNLSDYYDPALKERNLADLRTQPGFRFVQMDLRDADALRDLCRHHEFGAIAHLAAMSAVRYSMEHPLIYGEVNVQGSLNLLEAARRSGGPPVVLSSTGSVYGADTPVPFSEEAPALRQLAPYPASKRAMEMFAHPFHHLWGVPVTVLRFFNVYGPHGRPDMMPWQWTRRILRDEPLTLYDGGRLKRDWTYVDDIVSGFIAALDRPLGFEILNLGGGRPVENREFVKILERLLGREARIEDIPAPASEPPITYADVSKAARLLGYAPQVGVEEGLARFVEWFRAEGHA